MRFSSASRYGYLVLVSGIVWGGTARAQDRFIEDVRVSRAGDSAEIVIDLACPMRFVSDVATQQGVLIEVRVAPFEDCRQLGLSSGMNTEIMRPIGGGLADLVEIEYESLGIGDSLLMLHFARPVDYRISQQGNLRSLSVLIDLDREPSGVVTDRPREAIGPEPARRADRQPPADRQPLTGRVVRPETLSDYMINLLSTRERISTVLPERVPKTQDRYLYVSETTVDGATWYRLRLGFFASEEAAQAALTSLASDFPRAWIGRAEPEEIQAASSFAFDTEGLPTVAADRLSSGEDQATPAAANVAGSVPALESAEIATLLEQARQAVLDADFDSAIRVYTRLLQEPGDHQAEARELLGLARQRNGQLAHARAEYQAYLDEYPDGDGARRVRQRLSGLLATAEAPRSPLRETASAGQPQWDVASGLSQYYRRDVNQFDEDQAEIVTMSALMSDVDFSVSRSGGGLDMLGRISLSHSYDLLADSVNDRGDRTRISYAYLDFGGTEREWSLRMGRQSLHHWGVLGRFDGAHFNYAWAPDRRVHVTAGYPVESTRDSLETDREFYGFAVDFDNLLGEWDLSTFLNTQTIDGVDARRAIGSELSYVDDRRSLTTLFDYDMDFGELNTILVLGTWRLKDRLTLSALFDSRTSPILTTRNALIGQPVETVSELLLVWTEDEIRQLALDRTSRAQTVTLGLAVPMAERYQLNADVTQTEIESTVASGGVLALPGTGKQLYYTASVVGTGLFGSGDVTIITLRHGESDEFTQSLFSWDARFAIGRRIRINPRLRLAVWESLTDARRRETVSPSLRLLVNARNRYRIELEVGADRLLRTDLTSEQNSSGSFVTLGYRANF